MSLSSPFGRVGRRALATAVLVSGSGLPLALAAESSRFQHATPSPALMALALPRWTGLSAWPEPLLLLAFGVTLIGGAVMLRRPPGERQP